MDIYTLIATANFFLQIVVLMLLFVGVWFKMRKKFRQHGITMLSAVVLHTVAIFAIMIPAFIVISLGDFPLAISTITAVHGVLGLTAEVLGLWIVVSWRLRSSLRYCAPKKRWMLLTVILWSAALIMGVVIYLHFYTPLLPLQ